MMLGGGEDQGEMSSECSSGCQSGWTMYFDRSSSYEAPNSFLCKKGGSFNQEMEMQEEEEEDLSMVSDASSGPPHVHEDDQHFYCYHTSNTWCEGNGCLCSALVPAAAAAAMAKDGGKKRRVEAAQHKKLPQQQQQQQQQSALLDDTASSPLFSYSKNNFNENSNEGVLDFSCGFSATHLKGKSALDNHMGYIESSVPVKPNPRRPGSKKGGNRIW